MKRTLLLALLGACVHAPQPGSAGGDIGVNARGWYASKVLEQPTDPLRPTLLGLTVSGSASVGSPLIVTGAATIRGVSASGSAIDLSGTQAQITTAGGTGVQCVNGTQTCTFASGTNVTIQNAALSIQSSTIKLGSNLLDSTSAPTISSGFGASPSVASNNGTASFTINVGTGGVATSGVIGLPTATNGWVCNCADITTPGANITRMTASATNSCTVTNVAMSTGSAAAWTASDILHCTARGR